MDLMKGKKGIIFGVSNTHGIAYGIAKQLYDAEVSTKPINAKDLSEKILIKAIQEMKNTYTDKKKARCELSRKRR